MHSTFRRKSCLVLVVCCGTITMSMGCADDIEIHSSYSPSESLSAVAKTYDWVESTTQQSDAWAQRHDLRELIHASVDQGFSAKGYTRQASPQPGFFVRIGLTKETRTDSAVNPHGVTYEKIALIMDVVKPSTGRTIWRGAATTRLDSSAIPEKRRARVHQAVQMLVDRFTAGNK